MSTFLSIDIDYWNVFQHHESAELAEATLVPLLTQARQRGIPIRAVMNHHQMLAQVNRSGADLLVNVDTHADLAGQNVGVFNCGTWVAFVKWRHLGRYHWIRSHEDLWVGDCNGGDGWCAGHDWGQVRTRVGGKRPRILRYLPDCVGLGLCMSPSYSNPLLEGLFRQLVRRFDIPYRRGRRDELRRGVPRSPPKAWKVRPRHIQAGEPHFFPINDPSASQCGSLRFDRIDAP